MDLRGVAGSSEVAVVSGQVSEQVNREETTFPRPASFSEDDCDLHRP